MNPENQGIGTDPTSSIKRKRGRPRKDQSQISGNGSNVLAIRDQTLVHTDQVHITPGFERTNGSVEHSDESMVGQMVTGVIEATFDAGFLLSVKIGNSETSLRGIVLKSGHYMPVTTENDLAPHIQMINRSAVPIPTTGFHTPVHGSYRRGRGRGRARSESRMAFSVNGSGNQLEVYNEQSPVIGNASTILPAEPVVPKSGETDQIGTAQIQNVLETDNGNLSKPVTVKLSDEVVASNERKLPLKETQNKSPNLSDERNIIAEPIQELKTMQTMWPDSVNQTPSVHHNFRDGRAGKMTELLMAVQENLIDKQGASSQLPDFIQHHN